MNPLFLNLVKFLNIVIPCLEIDAWRNLNKSLKEILSPLHHKLSQTNDPENIAKIGNMINAAIRQFVEQNENIFGRKEDCKPTKAFYKNESTL